MAITDEARNHLFNTLREKLGARDAATMMELLPPVGWADVARRHDLDHLEAVMNLRFSDVNRRFDEMERRFDDRFAGIDRRFAGIDRRFTDVDRRFDDVDRRFDQMERRFGDRFGDIDRRFDELPERFATKDDLNRMTIRFAAWTIASQATLVAAVSLITSLR